MKQMKFAAALLLGSSMLFARAGYAAEKEKPADAKPAAAETKGDAKPGETKPDEGKGAPVKLIKPYGELTSLTDDQKSKIDAIHKKALAETSVINKKEKEDIMAVLSDAQKAELKELNSKAKKTTAAAKKPDAPAAAGGGDAKKDTEKKPDAK